MQQLSDPTNPYALHTEGPWFEPQRKHIYYMAPPVPACVGCSLTLWISSLWDKKLIFFSIRNTMIEAEYDAQ